MSNPTNESSKVTNQQEVANNLSFERSIFGYQKARGMMLAARYTSNRFPFEDVVRLVRNEQEWAEVEAQYEENFAYRVDFPISASQDFAINTTGAKKDVLPLLREMKKKSSNAALLLLKPVGEFVPRYAYDGGFSVLFLANREVILEINGRGFDGRGITSGQMICEGFRIPWDAAIMAHDMSLEMLLGFRTQHIMPEAYTEKRKQRIESLVTEDLSREVLEMAIPMEYEFPKDATLDLVQNVIPQLAMKYRDITLEVNRDMYTVQGNLVRGRAQVWEIFDPERWIKGEGHTKCTSMNYKKEMQKLNDENVAILYYLKISYDNWRFLTLYGEEELYLELQKISYDCDGYKRIKALHELLAEQRRIVEGCWRLVDEGLAARALAVGNCIEGRKSQGLRLHSSSKIDEWKTSAFSLQIVYNGILKAEKEKFGVESDGALEKRIDELFEREGRLGDKLFRRFQLQEPDLNGFTVERDSLGQLGNPDIFLNDPRADVVHAYCKKLEASIYGYAEFLRCIAPAQFFWK